MTPGQNPSSETVATDTLFKRMIVIAMTLSLAGMYGWLACFTRLPNGDFHFQWSWLALLWIAIALVSSIYFWRKIWPPTGDSTRKDVIKGLIVLLLPCVWWLLLPLRFMSGQHFWDVMAGLIAAAMVLSFGAWMVIRLIKAFEGNEAEDFNPDTVISPESSTEEKSEPKK